MALLLDELRPEALEIDILGTDISEPVLELARQGIYEPSRLTEIPGEVLARYFTKEGTRYRLDERVRNMVRFERHNIMTATDYPPADLILCRNVGRSETLVGSIRNHFQSKFPVERIYQRVSVPQGEE